MADGSVLRLLSPLHSDDLAELELEESVQLPAILAKIEAEA